MILHYIVQKSIKKKDSSSLPEKLHKTSKDGIFPSFAFPTPGSYWPLGLEGKGLIPNPWQGGRLSPMATVLYIGQELKKSQSIKSQNNKAFLF
jgi:hypothetical protein